MRKGVRATKEQVADLVARFRSNDYEPTLEEIAEGCRRIQAGWSAKDRRARWTGPEEDRVEPWLPPLTEFGSLDGRGSTNLIDQHEGD